MPRLKHFVFKLRNVHVVPLALAEASSSAEGQRQLDFFTLVSVSDRLVAGFFLLEVDERVIRVLVPGSSVIDFDVADDSKLLESRAENLLGDVHAFGESDKHDSTFGDRICLGLFLFGVDTWTLALEIIVVVEATLMTKPVVIIVEVLRVFEAGASAAVPRGGVASERLVGED